MLARTIRLGCETADKGLILQFAHVSGLLIEDGGVRAERAAGRQPPGRPAAVAVKPGARRAPAQHVSWADGPSWRLVIRAGGRCSPLELLILAGGC